MKRLSVGFVSCTRECTTQQLCEPRARLVSSRRFSEPRKKNFGKMVGLAPLPPNQLVVPMADRLMSKPVTKEYDPHVGYPTSTKQWYTLVRLDEYGPNSDQELRELEERILSEPDDTSDDDALETLSHANSESRLEDLEPLEQVVHHPQNHPAYQKPGGPCDHCGAAGTFRDQVLAISPSRQSRSRLSSFSMGPSRREGVRGVDPTTL